VKPFFRKLHRWLGLAMALQIVAWMLSGFYFALFPIETIRGEHLAREAQSPDPAVFADLLPVSTAWESVLSRLGPDARPTAVSLLTRDGKTFYRISGHGNAGRFTRLVDGGTGAVMEMLDGQAARTIADASLVKPGVIESVELVESVPPGSEIRGRELPVWRIGFSEPESLRLYIDPWTGEIVARRTARWRVFDFLWMLHIMDFSERDDFNTPLLQIAAALGLLVALSGVVFWALTTRLFRRRSNALPDGNA
jgi:uncharacterized iron-regulated membrane protein